MYENYDTLVPMVIFWIFLRMTRFFTPKTRSIQWLFDGTSPVNVASLRNVALAQQIQLVG